MHTAGFQPTHTARPEPSNCYRNSTRPALPNRSSTPPALPDSLDAAGLLRRRHRLFRHHNVPQRQLAVLPHRRKAVHSVRADAPCQDRRLLLLLLPLRLSYLLLLLLLLHVLLLRSQLLWRLRRLLLLLLLLLLWYVPVHPAGSPEREQVADEERTMTGNWS